MAIRPRVLLADDYAPLVRGLTRVLSPDCDIVGHATSVAELVRAATTCRPDIVIVDLFLPDGNGIDACRQLRAMQPDVKVILLTAADDTDIRLEALNAGASDFVSKYRTEQLLPAIINLDANARPH